MDRGVILQSRYAFAFSDKRRRSPAGVFVSVVLHVLIGILLLIRIREDFQRVLDAGNDGAGPRGGGGGGAGRVAYISLPSPAAAAPKAVAVEPPKETPPPVQPPVPTTPPPVVPPPVQEQPQVAVANPVASASTGDSVAGRGPGEGGGEGGGKGGGSGPGVGTGRGPGEGTGGGEGGTGRAPRPRYELIPPADDPPKELRGKEVRILFSVDADGKVRGVKFEPAIPSGKYAKRLKETMEGYRFHPALGPDGTAVAGTFEYTFTVF